MTKPKPFCRFWVCWFLIWNSAAAESTAFEETTLSINHSSWVQGIGYVEPITEVRRLAFKHPGIIASCNREIGQAVKRGEILMEQDNAEEKAAVELAESALAVARSELGRVLAGINPNEIRAKEQAGRAAEADAEYARNHFARIGRLVNADAATMEEHELAATDLKRKSALKRQLEAEADYLRHYVREEDRILGEARVRKAEKELEVAKRQLEQTILRAPLDGTILEILHREGETTHVMGNADPVLLLGEMSHLRIRAEFDENYALKIKPHQKAIIFGRAFGNREISGTVVLVKPVMGKKTVFTKAAAERKDVDVIQVLIEPDQSLALPVGMEVDVKVNVGG